MCSVPAVFTEPHFISSFANYIWFGARVGTLRFPYSLEEYHKKLEPHNL